MSAEMKRMSAGPEGEYRPLLHAFGTRKRWYRRGQTFGRQGGKRMRSPVGEVQRLGCGASVWKGQAPMSVFRR